MKALALMALLLLGCNPDDGVHYSFIVTNPSDLEFAQAAAREWNKCSPTVEVSVSTDSSDSGIELVYVPDLHVSGLNTTVDRIVYRHENHTSALIAHEMGHAMGLPHYGHGLMAADMEAFAVTPEDCAALRNRTTHYANNSQGRIRWVKK